jgi:hypothetical protein
LWNDRLPGRRCHLMLSSMSRCVFRSSDVSRTQPIRARLLGLGHRAGAACPILHSAKTDASPLRSERPKTAKLWHLSASTVRQGFPHEGSGGGARARPRHCRALSVY